MLRSLWACAPHGGGLQADDVRTRLSGLTTPGLQAGRTRQSVPRDSHGLLSVRTRPSGLTTPATPLRAEECRGHRSLPDSRPVVHARVA
jgi:hypothetical protein